MQYSLTPEVISGLVGVALALICQYSPKLNEAWAALSSANKRLVMGLLCLVAALVIGLVNCAWGFACFSASLNNIIMAAFVAWGGSQAAYGVIAEWNKSHWSQNELDEAEANSGKISEILGVKKDE